MLKGNVLVNVNKLANQTMAAKKKLLAIVRASL